MKPLDTRAQKLAEDLEAALDHDAVEHDASAAFEQFHRTKDQTATRATLKIPQGVSAQWNDHSLVLSRDDQQATIPLNADGSVSVALVEEALVTI